METVGQNGPIEEQNIFGSLAAKVQEAKKALEYNNFDYALPVLHKALDDARSEMALDGKSENWPPIMSLILATLAKAYEKRGRARAESSEDERASDLKRAQELYETASEVLMDEADDVTERENDF